MEDKNGKRVWGFECFILVRNGKPLKILSRYMNIMIGYKLFYGKN